MKADKCKKNHAPHNLGHPVIPNLPIDHPVDLQFTKKKSCLETPRQRRNCVVYHNDVPCDVPITILPPCPKRGTGVSAPEKCANADISAGVHRPWAKPRQSRLTIRINAASTSCFQHFTSRPRPRPPKGSFKLLSINGVLLAERAVGAEVRRAAIDRLRWFGGRRPGGHRSRELTTRLCCRACPGTGQPPVRRNRTSGTPPIRKATGFPPAQRPSVLCSHNGFQPKWSVASPTPFHTSPALYALTFCGAQKR
eukprot:gene6711-biopygen8966